MKKIQMELSDETISWIEDISKVTGSNKPGSVAISAQLAHYVLQEVCDGAEILIKKNDGSLHKLLIPGVNTPRSFPVSSG